MDLNNFIASQEKDINHLNDTITEENTRLTLSEKAIFNLTHALQRGRRILSLHEENLSSLKDIQERLSVDVWIEYPDSQEEPETKRLYESFGANISLGLSRISPTIDENIASLDIEIKNLRQSLILLEDELLGWEFTRDLSKVTIDRLLSSLGGVSSTLRSAKVALSPLRTVPREIWLCIFKECLMQEVQHYTMQVGIMPFRSVPTVLSRVCSSWRKIVRVESALWSYVTVYPMKQISSPDYSLVVRSFSKSPNLFTMMINLSQFEVFQDGAYAYSIGTTSSNSLSNDIAIPAGKVYDIHLVAKATEIDHRDCLRRWPRKYYDPYQPLS